ncbi:hypothetical protein PENSPDRAFT_687179 [Peniophora sp. CONT]|nr:hypothetical protein PENSPDRAFT_687179 [Peniophora sp. CONT]
MGDSGSTSVDERWKGTQNALAGLFCASLCSMDAQHAPSLPMALCLFSPTTLALYDTRTCRPTMSALRTWTSFSKLLPCPAEAGIATLLDPYKLFDAD